MHSLKAVRIRNFRSIVDQSFDLGTLTVIVGPNDAGKSNFLRALNLFFNGETDAGRPFDFLSDFSTRASVGKGKAKQIEISLDLEPPEGFSKRDIVRWKRYWRETSRSWTSEEVSWLLSKQSIPGTSKIKPWLDRIKYRYVPAIKGRDYFTLLLRDLHDTLAATIDEELRAASTDFIKAIRLHTDAISDTVSKSLGLTSQLQLPANLRSLFEVLDFETTSSVAPSSRSLQLRGDGVKVRHIAAILKFLADQEKKNTARGKIRATSIWGYEEPENNLELRRAAQHATELFEYSKQIQIILTTHSPAFYSLVQEHPKDVVGLLAVANPAGTRIEPFTSSSKEALDESLGLMPLVAPYILEQTRLLADQQAAAALVAAKLSAISKSLVVVAGETDAEYVLTALSVLAPELCEQVQVEHIGTAGKGGAQGGGDGALDSLVRHWIQNPALNARRTLVIYDCDANKKDTRCGKLTIRGLPTRPGTRVQAGIENLLPEAMLLSEYFEKTEKYDRYGGRNVFYKLAKKRLCRAVCDPAQFSDIPIADRFSNFKIIVDWVKELQASA